ncbi:MAG: hypothetical protein RMJ66_02815 [Bacteroidia bacterium]|nr:hypothetical protein [Bacteroidia bacterium]MDW8133978.1 hypothetical protein [Bacteroidia bacterium]
MALFLSSPYYWTLNPPLTPLWKGQEGKGVIFISPEDTAEASLELLKKVLQSIKLWPGEMSVWVAQAPLSPARVQIFSEKVLWVMGKLLPSLKIGVYEFPSLTLVKTVPAGYPPHPLLWVLPSLTEMLQDEKKKRLTWQWIRPLAMHS